MLFDLIIYFFFCFSNATSGRTEKVLKCVPTVSKFLFINSITFQGELRFKPSKMYYAKFTNVADEFDVCFSVHKNNFKYFDLNPEFTYVELPYKNESLNLCIIFPKPHISLREILNKLNLNNLIKLSLSSVQTEVEIHLPIIRLQSNVDLAYVLQLSGFCRVFEEENAEFTKMAKNSKGLYLESVISNSELNLQDLSKISSSIEKSNFAPAPSIYTSILLNRPFIYLVKCEMKKQQTRIIFSGVINVIE